MKKIFVVVLSVISAGELTIASEFISKLSKDEYDCMFLTTSNFANYLSSKGFKYQTLDIKDEPDTNRQLALQTIENFGPDYFLISDVYTLEYAARYCGLTFEDLKQYKIPIIGVDEYEYPSTDYALDYYATAYTRITPLINACDFLIRDCPINKLKLADAKTWQFSLFDKPYIANNERRESVRKALGIDADSKIIFFTYSYWEALNSRHVYSLKYLIKWIPTLLKEYIQAVGEKITVIHVGYNKWTDIDETLIDYRHFQTLEPTRFDDYLYASDLYMTLNVASVTLSKAVYANIPSIVFQNKKIIKFDKLQEKLTKMPKWYQEMAKEIEVAYPFRASTLGWFKFLEYVLQNNSYTEAFVEAPLFKMSSAISLLKQYLYDKDAINALKEKQRKYIAELLELPSSNEIMNEINAICNEMDY